MLLMKQFVAKYWGKTPTPVFLSWSISAETSLVEASLEFNVRKMFQTFMMQTFGLAKFKATNRTPRDSVTKLAVVLSLLGSIVLSHHMTFAVIFIIIVSPQYFATIVILGIMEDT